MKQAPAVETSPSQPLPLSSVPAETPSGSGLVKKPKFRKDIEGLRAIAILLVIAYHAHIPGFEGAYVGVDVFFVISGYLITWLLIYEIETSGRVDLIRFYSRRAKRLLPAACLMLLVTAAWCTVLYAPLEQLDLAETVFATATYRSNLYFSQAAVDYLGAEVGTSPFLHMWSLSLEEQFYFVWPVFVMAAAGAFLKRRSSGRVSCRKLLLWLVVIFSASFAISVHLTETRQPSAFFLTHARAWEFAIGAIGLLAPNVLIKHRAGREVIGWLSLAGILGAAVYFNEATQFPGLAALAPTVATVLLLQACEEDSASPIVARFLGMPIFQKIGKISYSWYLWHWPVLVLVGVTYGELSVAVRLLLVLFSLLIAIASYRFVEKPVRYHSVLSRRRFAGIVMAILLAMVGSYFSLGWKAIASDWSQQPAQRAYTEISDDNASVYETACHADYFVETPAIDICTTYGSASGQEDTPSAAQRVVLFGDSHAAQWYDALADIATAQNWTLTSLTKSGCPYVDVPVRLPAIGDYTACETWRENAVQYIQTTQPDLVILAASTEESIYPFSQTQWIEGNDRTVERLSAVSEKVVLLRDSPFPAIDVPMCFARNEWRPSALSQWSQSACEYSGNNVPAQIAYDAQKTVASRHDNVFTLDMNTYICPNETCDLRQGEIVLYRDDSHLTVRFTKTLKEELYEEINAIQTADVS